MNKWKTQYNKNWEDDTVYSNFSKWKRSIPNKPTFAVVDSGRFCPGIIIGLSNIGVRAFKRHLKSAKHVKANVRVASSTPI